MKCDSTKNYNMYKDLKKMLMLERWFWLIKQQQLKVVTEYINWRQKTRQELKLQLRCCMEMDVSSWVDFPWCWLNKGRIGVRPINPILGQVHWRRERVITGKYDADVRMVKMKIRRPLHCWLTGAPINICDFLININLVFYYCVPWSFM